MKGFSLHTTSLAKWAFPLLLLLSLPIHAEQRNDSTRWRTTPEYVIRIGTGAVGLTGGEIHSKVALGVGVSVDLPITKHIGLQPALFVYHGNIRWSGYFGSEQHTEAHFHNRFNGVYIPLYACYYIGSWDRTGYPTTGLTVKVGPYMGYGITAKAGVEGANSDLKQTLCSNLYKHEDRKSVV